MVLSGLPAYSMSNVVIPEMPNVAITWLENGDVEIINATEEQIRAIRQAIYDAAGVPVPAETLAKEQEIGEAPGIARAWFASHPAAVAFVRMTPAEQEAQIDAMTTAQLKTLLKYLTIAVVVLVKRELL